MYELIEIEEAVATRFLKLKNMETNMIEECFDDSALVSHENFKFMQLGQVYECKIELFGRPVDEKADSNAVCKIINKEVVVGRALLVEVQIDDNTYYIDKKILEGYLDGNSFYFHYSRKDLLQVNDTIHAEY